MVKPMTVICAWCGATIQEGSADDISHGICDACADKMRSENNLPPRKPKWRELFPVPVSNQTKMVAVFSRINGVEFRLIDYKIGDSHASS